jgi:hypothetical protein
MRIRPFVHQTCPHCSPLSNVDYFRNCFARSRHGESHAHACLSKDERKRVHIL